MKILNLKAENIKRIKAVDITPEDATVIVSGKNGQGKTSVLDSILFALGGKDALKQTPKPVRDGAESASIDLDMGEYRVVRTFTKDGTTKLELYNKDGLRLGTPQRLLDEIVGKIAFDPLEFANMNAKEQKQVLLDVLGIAEEVQDLQMRYQTKYQDRRLVGRDKTTAEGHLATLEKPKQAPKNLIDTAEVSQQLREAQQNNSEVESMKMDVNRIDTRIDSLQRQIDELKAEKAEAKAKLKGKRKINTSKLEEQLENAGVLNEAYNKAQQYKAAEEAVKKANSEYDQFTKELDQLLKDKNNLIESAELPIEGLDIDSEGVTYNKIPFSQLSSAEQLKVSLAIAMKMNPKLRVMRILDGSLLDSDNLQVIRDMANDQDYQVWIERVEDDGTVGIVIEDGEVRSA